MINANARTRAYRLQRSLLATLGLIPVACGGSAATAGAGGESGGGLSGVSGSASHAGLGGTEQYAGGGGADGGARAIPACESPTTSPGAGLVGCSNGFEHRLAAVACPLPTDNGGAAGDSAGAAGDSGAGNASTASIDCSVDADCASYHLGFCDHPASGMLPTCQAGCVEDADCGPSRLCLCDGSAHGGQCVSAGCQTDAECGAGSLCASAVTACGDIAFTCLSNQDDCTTAADCATSGVCEPGFHGERRACMYGENCGRPFIVADAPRLASVAASTEWLTRAALTPDLSGLGALARARLCAHYTQLGRMEHASIAAFARFSLQLLLLGAPAHLIEACTRAIADETAHTRMCFALASHYGGEPVGPTRLDINGCLDAVSLTEIMKLVLSEGCLGETGAALEALEAAAVATDPAIQQAFAQIARDEQRHAELAFQFLRWGLAQSPLAVHAELAREAEARLRQFAGATGLAEVRAEPGAEDLSKHGLLPQAVLRTVRQQAAQSVIAPLLASLFAAEASRLTDPATAQHYGPATAGRELEEAPRLFDSSVSTMVLSGSSTKPV
jgi:hypothetical protein